MRRGSRESRNDQRHAVGTSTAVPAKEWAARPGLFEGVGPQDVADIAVLARRRRAARHAFFFQQGDRASGLHVLLHGRVKLVQTTPEGHQVVVRIIGPGDMFAGAGLFGDPVYPAAAEAMSASEALVWPTALVEQLFLRHPKLALNALRVVARRLGELQDRYRELATERVEQRIARALTSLARQAGRKEDRGVSIDMELRRQDLAELTGTTLFTVSRTLSAWHERGLVDAGRARIVIREPHGLVAIAEDLPERRSPR